MAICPNSDIVGWFVVSECCLFGEAVLRVESLLVTSADPTVFVVDDDASSLRATARLLRAAGHTVRTFTRPDELLGQLEQDSRGCIVVDLQMPGISGLELQQALDSAGCELPLVFLTGHADIPSSVRAMRQGAEDFIEKTAPPEYLLAAVRRSVARYALNHASLIRKQAIDARLETLTPRETEVLTHVVRGRLNKQIASALGIHERTVKLHRTSITHKLNVHSVAELTSLCHEAGLINSADSSDAEARGTSRL